MRIVKRVKASPDGTTRPASSDPSKDGLLYFTPEHWPVVADGAGQIDAFTAVQLGMWMMLSSLRPFSQDLIELLHTGAIHRREMKVNRIFLDWPETEDDEVPVPSFTVYQADDAAYEHDNFSSYVLEDTLDRFGEGTVLKKTSHMTALILVEGYLADKDDRSGVRKAFEDAFLDELDGEQGGRRVLVAPYFDRVARYVLQSIGYPDDAQNAHANRFPIQARFSADIDVVKLVPAPADLTPSTATEVR